MTLVELIMAMALMVVVATMFVTILQSIQSSVVRQQERSVANDQARAGLHQLDRELRSGNIFYAPGESFTSSSCGGYICPSNFSLRVHTQANATTRTPPQQCVQWLIHDRKLLRRAWAPGATNTLEGWRVIADDIVNRDLTPAVPAFSLDPTPGARVLNVTLMVNPDLGSRDAPTTLRVDTSISLRNATAGDPCTPIPAS